MPKWSLVAILWLWLLVLTLTHFGERSPYSYGWATFQESSARLNGAVVNPDAIPLYKLHRFFYDGAPLDWTSVEAQNLRLPLHSFAVSIVAGLTRSYLFAAIAVNLLFAMLVALAAVNLADRHGIQRGATLVALLTFFSLPIYVEYLGQPLHYVAGISVSYLAILSIAANEERNPWTAALATAILSLNYDPYVYLAAAATFVLFVRRFARRRDYAIYLVAATLPNVLWGAFLRVVSNDTLTQHLREHFIRPVVAGWMTFVRDPLHNPMLPFVAGHVGMQVALQQIVALLHWPLVIACAALLVWQRPRVTRAYVVVALLPVFFFLEQFVAAAFEWELNPRRAIPVALAFGVAWVVVAHRAWSSKPLRALLVALCLLNATLAMSDTLFRTTVMGFIHSGEGIRHGAQAALAHEKLRLDDRSLPKLMHDEPLVWRDLGRARLQQPWLFAGAQLGPLLLLVGFFWLTARARLLPAWSPAVVFALWVVSFVRFV